MSSILKNQFVTIDMNTSFPVVTVTLTEKEPTDSEFDEYLKFLGVLFDTANAPFVLLIDPSKCKYLDSNRRIKLGKWMKAHEQQAKTKMIANAYVITNFVQRSILKGINLIQNNIVPTEVFSELDTAMKWCDEKVRSAKKSIL